jgi:hypothetical protein
MARTYHALQRMLNMMAKLLVLGVGLEQLLLVVLAE